MIRFALGLACGIAAAYLFGLYLLADTETTGGADVHLRWEDQDPATDTVI